MNDNNNSNVVIITGSRGGGKTFSQTQLSSKSLTSTLSREVISQPNCGQRNKAKPNLDEIERMMR